MNSIESISSRIISECNRQHAIYCNKIGSTNQSIASSFEDIKEYVIMKSLESGMKSLESGIMFDDTFIYVCEIKEWLNRNYVNRSKCQSIARIASSKAYHDMIDFIDIYIMKDVL